MTNTIASTHTSAFIKASEVALVLDISRAYAYRIIKTLNSELNEAGCMSISGQTNREYFLKKFGLSGAEVIAS